MRPPLGLGGGGEGREARGSTVQCFFVLDDLILPLSYVCPYSLPACPADRCSTDCATRVLSVARDLHQLGRAGYTVLQYGEGIRVHSFPWPDPRPPRGKEFEFS